eukprot:m51a1_g3027 putative orf msv144 neurospora crassa gb:u01220 (162) ;mRNA; r:893064-893593
MAETVIFVKLLTGKSVPVCVDLACDTVGNLKQKLHDRTGMPPVSQRLVFGGKVMSDDSTHLCDLGVVRESIVHLLPAPASVPQLIAVLVRLPEGRAVSVRVGQGAAFRELAGALRESQAAEDRALPAGPLTFWFRQASYPEDSACTLASVGIQNESTARTC